MALSDEIKQPFKRGSILTKLIYVNLGIFLIVNIVYILFILINPAGISRMEINAYFQTKFLTYLMVPANISKLIIKPWTLFTYMFLHFNFLHILFNLIWLFLFGRIFLMYLSEKQLLSTYILGGLSGAILFIFFYNVFPGLSPYVEQSEMLGASAGVMAIAMAICFYVPNYAVYVPLIGPVKLKYIAIFFIVTDILQIASYNAGGHIAHLGGVIYGYFFVQQHKKGRDLGKGLNSILDSITSLFTLRKKRMKVSYKRSVKDMSDMEYNKYKAQTQEEINRILDKIAKSGYDSLTKKEKETLFRMSNRS
jgi:membrane associated rhomboid family serine protease